MTFTLNTPMFDFLVLSVIADGDAYGYQISQIIKKAADNTKDSTLYPVLKRLQDNQFVDAYDQQFQGRNRKYYTITDAGHTHFQKLLDEWAQYKKTIDEIIKGGVSQ